VHYIHDERIRANHDKRERSRGELNAKVRLGRVAQADVMYVCIVAIETRQHRAPWQTQTEDVLEHTLIYLSQALVLPADED
jgi:hypothetical protein